MVGWPSPSTQAGVAGWPNPNIVARFFNCPDSNKTRAQGCGKEDALLTVPAQQLNWWLKKASEFDGAASEEGLPYLAAWSDTGEAVGQRSHHPTPEPVSWGPNRHTRESWMNESLDFSKANKEKRNRKSWFQMCLPIDEESRGQSRGTFSQKKKKGWALYPVLKLAATTDKPQLIICQMGVFTTASSQFCH